MIIALTGAKGSGKDYFASFAIKKYTDLFIRQIAFADPIKEDLINILGLYSIQDYDDLKRSNVVICGREMPGREIVRNYGMLKRSYDPDQFVRYVADNIKAMSDCIWIITDLRFENELKFLKTNDAKIVKVIRKDIHYDGHITEQNIVKDADCDYIIHNDGSLRDYERSIDAVWSECLPKKTS